MGINKEDISFSNINVFLNLNRSLINEKENIEKSIYLGKELFSQGQQINLPPIITDSKVVWGYQKLNAEPNYITQKSVIALTSNLESKDSIKGKIVFIPSADPGFDWIFSKGIAGLITMWGGSNSHMAIRSGELQIPAVIGCGEDLYLFWSNQKQITNRLFIEK